jgi:methionyl-tRNA formyltransferase
MRGAILPTHARSRSGRGRPRASCMTASPRWGGGASGRFGALIAGRAIRTPQIPPSPPTRPASSGRGPAYVGTDLPGRSRDLIRGLDPWPSAETSLGDVSLKIFGASVAEGRGAPGTLLALSKDGAVVAAGEGAVRFTVLQPPGKRRMGPLEFSLGHSAFKIGVVLS